MSEAIVITGMGAVTPVGVGTENYWNALMAGRCGIGEITGIDAADLPVRRAGEVRDFKPKDFMPTRLALDLEPYARFAYAAAAEAWEQSGLTGSDRVAVVMGTALHGFAVIAKNQTAMDTRHRPSDPKLLTRCMGNIAAASFAIEHSITGPSLTVSTACSSGGDAVYLARMLLRSGAADAVLVMAGEAAISPALIRSLALVQALSPTGESLPFDLARNGFVLGEGGGALVLERGEHAAARGAKTLATLLGCANNNDAYHTVSPEPDGAGAAACMRLALADAGLCPENIGYLNAHGTATRKGDVAESAAIGAVFGAYPVPVSSTKGATGHMMGAGGITELIACAMAVRTGLCPPTLGLTEQDPECPLHLVRGGKGAREIRAAMSNAMGFGGQNSCVIVGA